DSGADGTTAADSSFDQMMVAAPLPPTNVRVVGTSGTISLAWTASFGATGYVVMRATAPGGPYAPAGMPAGTVFDDSTGLVPGTTYYYVVRAVNGGGTSADSAEVSARFDSGHEICVGLSGGNYGSYNVAAYDASPPNDLLRAFGWRTQLRLPSQ